MENLVSNWLEVIGVLAVTLAAVAAIRGLIYGVSREKWIFLRELAPPISNLVIIIGLRIAVGLAPINPRIAGWINDAIYVLGVVIFLGLARKAALISVEWASMRATVSPTLRHGFVPLLRNIITLFVFLSGAIMVLKHFDYDVLSLLTALGVGSLAVGLAAKETLSNMISGFMLLIDQNLKPGDRINLTGSVGVVEEIGLRSTRIRMGDGNVLIVPNAELVNTKILNLSLPGPETTCSTTIRMPYSTAFEKIRTACLEAIDSTPLALKGRDRWVNLARLDEGHQTIQIGFWIQETAMAGTALSQFHEQLLQRLVSTDLLPLHPGKVG